VPIPTEGLLDNRHVFNEAMLAGLRTSSTYLAFWYHASWEQIQTRPESRSPFQVTVFPIGT
jgi:hypothetical protein